MRRIGQFALVEAVAEKQLAQPVEARVKRFLRVHCKPCTTDIYLHIDARMADYIHTHP